MFATGKARYYRGRVSSVDEDGKYNIVYADGDTEKHVGREYVRAASELATDATVAGI